MSTPVPSALPAPVGRAHRDTAVDRLLDGLEALVARHRALTSQAPEEQGLQTELIGAEVAHELAIAQAALRRPPRLSIVEPPADAR